MANKGEYHILVVEDNPGDYALVEDFLLEEIEVPHITHVESYKAAKALLNSGKKPLDIILLDLSLPDKTGILLIEDIVEISCHAPVIVLTGYTDFDFGVKSLSMGISDYILKEEITALSLYKSIIYSIERKKITTALEASETRVRNFANQLNNALEDERSRIAREIHDEFGQQLSGLKMSLSSLKKFKGIDADMEETITAMVADVNTSIESVRQIANELRPALLDKLGLFSAIEWLLTEFEKKTRTKARLFCDKMLPEINKALEINIFRICQEALTNIAKHANASLVHIKIDIHRGQLSVKIIDNGKGIAQGNLKNPLSMGLLNMRERARLIDSELNINSDNTGTIIELIVNLHGK